MQPQADLPPDRLSAPPRQGFLRLITSPAIVSEEHRQFQRQAHMTGLNFANQHNGYVIRRPGSVENSGSEADWCSFFRQIVYNIPDCTNFGRTNIQHYAN
jgi:hypothetical protein